MGDKPRWNSDDAKFGKRRRLLCVCMSGDLLNRPWFQFHASEFDRGEERGGERERVREGERGSLVSNVPSGRTAKGWRDGRREVKGEKEAGRKGDKVQEENLYLPLQTHHHFITQRTHTLFY